MSSRSKSNINTATSSGKTAIPKKWPPEVVKLYDPIAEHGKGRFATVVLARRKIDSQDCNAGEIHALKVVGSRYASEQESGYARREIEILSQLSHPNIVRLIDYWEPPKDSRMCVAVMALNYAKGPTLESLLNHGGKLSLIFTRVVSAQLIDAVAYLHARACVHRDIKPDNLVITGAAENQDDIWDDILENEVNLFELRKRWKVTLVDFGFSRALTPEDFDKLPPSDLHHHDSLNLSLSRSRRLARQMSAVGNRSYAAPEILMGVQACVDASKGKQLDKSYHPMDVTQTLSEYVSFYGLMADAYSIGNTLRHMLTGVPPDEEVNERIALENSPIILAVKLLCGCHTSSSERKRPVQHRRYNEIPGEVLRLLRGLTEPNPQKRTTVSDARKYPWVDAVLEGYKILESEVSFLDFTQADNNHCNHSQGTKKENDSTKSSGNDISADALPASDDG